MPSKPKSSNNDMAVLNERFGVMPGARVPEYDSPSAKAFAAVDLHSPKASLFALVCAPELPPRTDVLAGFAQLSGKPILAPEDWGVIDWPPHDGRASVVVLQRPSGPRVRSPDGAPATPLRDSEVRSKVLMPLLPLFRTLEEQSLTHCAVRADNLFFDGPKRTSVVLGEGFSGPPGYSQPAIYETIERGMAMPAGRGPGQPPDDLYALGVMLAILALGHDPCAGMTANEVVAAKIHAGSYGALFGRTRLPLHLLELLRGLLCDDGKERWGVADLEMWLSGRHVAPKQPVLPSKSQRPFEMGGKACWSARGLAHAMAHNWAEAFEPISTGQIADWLRRSLLDEAKADAVAETVTSTKTAASPALVRDYLIAQTLIVLDPAAPLRYKGLAAAFDSLGQVLAIEFERPEARQHFVEAIMGRLPQAWFAAQMAGPQLHSEARKELRGAEELLASRDGAEVGVVRCLYRLNPDIPCRSPLLARRNVTRVDQLLEELERLAAAGPPEGSPVDLHIGAFCAGRLHNLPRGLLKNLFRLENDSEQRLAMLSLLALAQREAGRRPVPALAAWIVRSLGPAVETYRNRVVRQQLAERVERLAAQGDLIALAGLIDDQTARDQDDASFQWATAQFRQITGEIAWLEAGGLTDHAHVTRGSQQAATVVSAVLSGLGLVVLALAYAV